MICRNEFQQLGDDLVYAKGRDMDRYYDILEQLKESYRRCGPVCFLQLHPFMQYLHNSNKLIMQLYRAQMFSDLVFIYSCSTVNSSAKFYALPIISRPLTFLF